MSVIYTAFKLRFDLSCNGVIHSARRISAQMRQRLHREGDFLAGACSAHVHALYAFMSSAMHTSQAYSPSDDLRLHRSLHRRSHRKYLPGSKARYPPIWGDSEPLHTCVLVYKLASRKDTRRLPPIGP